MLDVSGAQVLAMRADGTAGLFSVENALAAVIIALFASWLLGRPKVALYFWLGVLCLVPFWATVSVGSLQVPPATVAAIVVFPSCLGRSLTGGGWRRGDTFITVLVAVTFGVTWQSDAPNYVLSALVVQGLTSYFVARRLAARVGAPDVQRAVAHLTVIVAIWTLVEFVLRLHVFSDFVGTPELSFWNAVQVRGSFDRSEAAWGHAIALGAWLSLGLPFVMAGGLKRSGLCVALVFVAACTTLSRGPIIGCLLGFALVVIFTKGIASHRRTLWILLFLVVGLAAVPPLLNAAGQVQEELDSTVDYRATLLEHAPSDLNWLSLADNVLFEEGRLRYRGLGSIDNAFLLMALEAGLVLTGLYLLALLACGVRVVRRLGSPADVAMASQIVVLATVAMITQYQAALYFVAGLAVAFGSVKDDAAQRPRERLGADLGPTPGVMGRPRRS